MFIGVDIGGTSIKVGLVSKNGSLKAKESFPVIKGEDQKVTIEKLGDFILCLAKENKLNVSEIEGIGIGCPGAINSEKGTCDSSPNLKWSSLPVVDIIGSSLDTFTICFITSSRIKVLLFLYSVFL